MARKTTKTTKKKAVRKTSATDDRVVFAFRLTKKDRDLIHKAAGPRGASQFVLEAALKAAARAKA